MSEPTPDVTPAYQVEIHKRALAELRALPVEHRREMRHRLAQLGESEEPTAKPYVTHLAGTDCLRVRETDYRAVCRLSKPHLRVLLIGEREHVYERIDTALSRDGVTE
jgi:mRNA-degrading endonuclease RelE of RelBE toxin-antitoxin system